MTYLPHVACFLLGFASGDLAGIFVVATWKVVNLRRLIPALCSRGVVVERRDEIGSSRRDISEDFPPRVSLSTPTYVRLGSRNASVRNTKDAISIDIK